ncbi:MAG: LLM class flavin-dependent oxidoreductase [Rhodothermales bacterium]|nr:LLM class flavin-dependent oxidoreductase [Rhodothermales bacterium]MBO6778218.1 LLM class flavin-dependent oxidoreductase [Rhodothermales bacterium]
MPDIRSEALQAAEFSWFAPICDGDDRYLGARDPAFRSSWENTSRVLLEADRLGFRNSLCPSSYQVGQDTWTFAAALAPSLRTMGLLPAVRMGELHPPMLARAIATLDHILKGRLTLNVISSDLPGETLSSEDRYARSAEVIQILRQAWTRDEIDFRGDFYRLALPSAPVKPYQQNGGPLLYFGGYSPAGLDLCARECDVYLMWPDTEAGLTNLMEEVGRSAASYGRTLDYGLRVHVVVRETEAEARAWAASLVSRLPEALGTDIRNRSQDARSLGVARQTRLREDADTDGYVEPELWTGIGRARSGCGAALVGDPDQVAAKLQRYMDMGIRSFILSGYPHLDECRLFARHVLPRFRTAFLPDVQGRVSSATPETPLGAGPRF